jgi:hypothetical protein
MYPEQKESQPVACMTPKQFYRKMLSIKGDAETTHLLRDKLMVELLKSLGYEAGVKVFEKGKRFYA